MLAVAEQLLKKAYNSMTVKRRKTTSGYSKYYTYRFKINGQEYTGPCLGTGGKLRATTKAEAEAYEKQIKDEAKELQRQKTVKALIENRREELTGGSKILISDAFDQACRKPRRREPSEKQLMAKRSYWRDFVAFINKEYPDLLCLSDVRKKHAEEYISYIRKHGRYDKNVEQKGKQNYKRNYNLSNKSCNAFQIVITEVFALLHDDAGLIENPFSHIQKLDNKSETREAFTEKELKKIFNAADDFIYPLFAIGISTALREEDVCLLKWKEIDLEAGTIRRKMEKTGNYVEIPILPTLHGYLSTLHMKRNPDSEYVLPVQAKMYQTNRTGVSTRIKKFLNELKIETQKEVRGRDRKISVKDFHSLRHTFCYLCGIYNVPFVIVKSVVGHMTDDMTHMYQKHADMNTKREKLAALPDFFTPIGIPEQKVLTAKSFTKDEIKGMKNKIIDTMKVADDATVIKIAELID